MRKNTLKSQASTEELKVLTRAAELSGLRLGSFVRSAAVQKARKILRENEDE